MVSVGCSRQAQPATERIVFLPFENLTGDASLNWVQNAASAIGVEDLTGVSGVTALRAATLSDGYLAQASRFVHGYFTGTAGNHALQVDIEDASRHKTIETIATSGGGALAELNAAAKRIDESAHAFSSANPEAVAAWGNGDFEKAVMLDPDFGVAWLAWAEKLNRSGNPSAAIDIASGALDHTKLRTPADRARLELFLANARHDPAAREQALSDLIQLTPGDPALLVASSAAEMEARNFKAAAGRYRELARIEPSTSGVLNSLGYAQALGGDLEGARKTFEQYGEHPADKPNSLDSLGEVHFMLGRFAEAEKYFLDAQQANPALAAGQDLLKAAYSRFLTGDAKAADSLAQQYFDFRSKQHDPLVDWREACWLYATGRTDQAMAKLATASNRAFAEKQAAIWRTGLHPVGDLESLKQHYESTSPTEDAQIRVIYASALLAAGKRDEARALLATWPMPWSPGDPLLESMVLPETLELRNSLGLPAR